jgi:glutamate dehydrogenase
LARDLSALEYIFPALDLVDLTNAQDNATLAQVAQTYFGVDAVLGLSAWRDQINRLPTTSLWQTQARGSARDDVYAIASQITLTVLSKFGGISGWSEANAAAIERLCQLLGTISGQGPDLAPVSVALRELRHLA